MSPTLRAAEVRQRRLQAQRLSIPGPADAAAVVEHLGCVQSQEWAHAFWSLGLRARGTTYAGVRTEFDAGAFVRTHVLRPTWHYVSPADLGWILALTSPRVQQRNAGTYRRLGLDEALLQRAAAIIVEATRTATPRAELGMIMQESGIQTGDGMWLAHAVMWAELEGLVCSGPLRGQQHTYVPVEQRVDPARQRRPDDPAAELATRFLRGRGPSTAADLARWSSLSRTEARAALGRISDLESGTCEDETLWWLPVDPVADPAADDDHRAWWLPLYDEFCLSHTAVRIPLAPGHPHRPGADVFVGSVVAADPDVGALDLGRWRRTVRGDTVDLQTEPARDLSQGQRNAVAAAGQDLRAFLLGR